MTLIQFISLSIYLLFLNPFFTYKPAEICGVYYYQINLKMKIGGCQSTRIDITINKDKSYSKEIKTNYEHSISKGKWFMDNDSLTLSPNTNEVLTTSPNAKKAISPETFYVGEYFLINTQGEKFYKI